MARGLWLLLSLAAGQPALPNLRGTGALEQILVFDAGSSGTRIHVFNMQMIPGTHVPRRVDLSVRDDQTFKVKPGLSEFAKKEDLKGCEENIQSLVAFANKFVEESRRKDTPVLLKATAGLRAVPAEQADAVLNTVRSTLSASGYKFQEDWVDIIKGKEEAGLAWIAANYLQGTFQAGGASLGVIEMGGGSTQVSFELQPGEKDNAADNDYFEFRTAMGQVYSLYAHSYLGFGQDYAQSKLQDCMSDEARSDPCYPRGYSRVNRLGARLDGQGDAPTCETNIQSLLFKEDTAPGRYAHELRPRGSMIATENFFYVRKDLNLQAEGVCPSEAEAREACGKDLAGGTSERGCFALSYQRAFLSALQALDQGTQVQVKRKINGGDIDWALGAALAHLLQTRSGGWSTPLTLTLLAALALMMVSVVVVQRPKGAAKKTDPTIFGKNLGLE
ncbi:unnamed protein product [Effrenium voratum]|nr:unnamed protein product [Effrenium voratum]